MDDMREVQIGSDLIYEGRILDFYRDTVRLPNGHSATRELVRHNGAVAVVPLLDDGRVIRVRVDDVDQMADELLYLVLDQLPRSAEQYARLRVGVGHKPDGWDLADWVLSRYATQEERAVQFEAFLKAADAVLKMAESGVQDAMQLANASSAAGETAKDR